MQIHRTYIAATIAVLLTGCSGLHSERSHNTERVAANPAGFAPTAKAPTPDAQKLAEFERQALMSTIEVLRDEVDQLKQLFRLQNTPLDPVSASADAFTARSPAKVAAAKTLPAGQPAAAVVAPALVAAPAAAIPIPIKPATAETPQTYTTLFQFASSTLDDSARAALAGLSAQLTAAGSVKLSAYADTVGNAAINSKLANDRAAAVAAELVKLGVPRERIDISAKVADSVPPQSAQILGLFRSADSVSRRVDVALLATAKK